MENELNENITEQQLWEYIDGTCSDAERRQMEHALATDRTMQERYAVLTTLNESLAQLEPETPSLRFSKNVMEAIAKSHPAAAAKRYVNLAIVRGIAAFFLLLLATAITCAVTDQHGTATNHFWTSIGNMTISNYFSSPVVNGIVAANIVLCLICADSLLRKRKGAIKQHR